MLLPCGLPGTPEFPYGPCFLWWGAVCCRGDDGFACLHKDTSSWGQGPSLTPTGQLCTVPHQAPEGEFLGSPRTSQEDPTQVTGVHAGSKVGDLEFPFLTLGQGLPLSGPPLTSSVKA
jgi:hypothetical protein